MEFVNGGVYKRKNGEMFVLVYLYNDKWGMLHIDRNVIDGMSAPFFQVRLHSKFKFTEEELIKYFDANNWEMLDGRLRIEKIDSEMRCVDHTIGELEPCGVINNKHILYTNYKEEKLDNNLLKPGMLIKMISVASIDEPYYKVGDIAKLLVFGNPRWKADFTMSEKYENDGIWWVSPEDFVVLNSKPAQNKQIIDEFNNKRKLII